MHITIVAVGKVREPFVKEGMELYRSRIAASHTLSFTNLPEEKVPDHCSPRQKTQIMDAEWDRFFRTCRSPGVIIALQPDGELLSSGDLALRLKQYELGGKGPVTFLIGGPLGLPAGIVKRADLVLSLSRMTFPHQLVRIMLLEQIYRADCINRNIPYHK